MVWIPARLAECNRVTTHSLFRRGTIQYATAFRLVEHASETDAKAFPPRPSRPLPVASMYILT